MPNRDKLMFWIQERYEVLQKKRRGEPAPWSTDPTFQSVYFCNVHREDDKVTQWIRREYLMAVSNYAALGGRGPLNTEFNMVMARLVNKTESLDKLRWPWLGEVHDYAWRRFELVMAEAGAWGSAYIVSTCGRAQPKHEYVQELLKEVLEQVAALPYTGTLANAHTLLVGVRGLASFMAAQVVADLKNTLGHILYTAPDWWTWCAAGPGSLRGMAWVLGVDKVSTKEFNATIPQLHEWVSAEFSRARVCAQDLQNCLCEFDKYMRVSTGSGRSKRKYNGN